METATQKQAKPRLEIDLESMKRIEDQVGQWMILEEHWTQFNLDRRQQLEYARTLHRLIKAEIKQAYSTCSAYSEV